MPVLAAQTQQKASNVSSAAASALIVAPAIEREGPPGRRRSASHSRSASASGFSDGPGIRNLNRWSSSTTSSVTSTKNSQRPPSFGRRTSLDAIVLLSPTNAGAQSPKRSPKSRLAPLNNAPRGSVVVALPSVDQRARSGSPAQYRNQAPQSAYASRYQKSGVDGGGFWDNYQAAQVAVRKERQVQQTGASPARSQAMPRESNGSDNYQNRGHARNRSQTAKGSSDTTSSAKSRDRSTKQPSQKAMLSRALQKANTAVQLDNAQNFEGARESYAEACELLQQVLMRTAGEDDKKKLEAIRRTYTSRIDELDQIGPVSKQDGKALPARPESMDYKQDGELSPIGDDLDEIGVIETATVTRIVKDSGGRSPQPIVNVSMTSSPARVSTNVRQMNEPPRIQAPQFSSNGLGALRAPPSLSILAGRERYDNMLQQPMDNNYMPPPLSPRRPSSSARPAEDFESEVTLRADFSAPAPNRILPDSEPDESGRILDESTSWLDPIDETAGSPASSVHSRSSYMGIRRKHIRATSGDTEAEFDAALDAAVEAAYDDGFEPMDMSEIQVEEEDGDLVVANALRKVELAKERVRQTERETGMFLEQERQRQRQKSMEAQQNIPEDFYDGNDSEEEERLLEEMTRGDVMDVFSFGIQPKPSVPRESDSSGVTNRTWHSSLASNPPTATTATTLSTVAELESLPSISKANGPLPPPPTQALPTLPPAASAAAVAAAANAQSGPSAQGVRSRRLSGQNAKQLKIETSRLGQPAQIIPGSVSAVESTQREQQSYGAPRMPASAVQRPASPAFAGAAINGIEPMTPPLPEGLARDDGPGGNRSDSPAAARPFLRKNYSSSSLRSMKTRNLSVTNLDETSDISPGTPSSNQFGSTSRLPALPSLPTPVGASFRDKTNSGSTGGYYLFEDSFHSPDSPGSPNPLHLEAPVPLEPCPTLTSLRPFWLMRCLFQTLAHPRGGYLSNKLFIPKDVWKVKGVKLKNVEDKIANCDLLTAALQKLDMVDTCDADAVLAELQSFEAVLDQVKLALTRKLGGEVGKQGLSATLFKDASVSPDIDLESMVPRSSSMSGKGSSFSWRRLRSKNSSAGLSNAYAGKSAMSEGQKESLAIDSLPMTSNPTSRPAKRDLRLVQFTGPNANYMSSLARLFDVAQVIDPIARQVDDPGLKNADKTQVGLNLSTKIAAEFFALYVCRFVLTDLTMLLEKFIKRGSEWVLT